MQTITAVVITKNEEHNILECLESVRWANEIVVVDADSTDRTVEIARKYTDKVFVRPWPGFGMQKNFGIGQTSSDWILCMDADERVSPELKATIEELLKSWSPQDPVAFRMPFRTFYYGQWIRWGGLYPDYHTRLFRRGAAYFDESILVHEHLIIKGAVGTLKGDMIHHTERKIEDHFRKFGLYTTLAAQEKLKSRRVVHWYDLLFRPLVILVKNLVLKQGFRDGVCGLIVCVFSSMYSFVKYAKLWELTQHADTLYPRDR